MGPCKSIKDYGHRLDADGNPEIKDCQRWAFPVYYNSPESFAVFGALYSNKYNLQDKFFSYWQVVSNRLSGNKYVIGFDPINEPLPSNPIRDPFLLLPGRFDQEQLDPLYSKLFKIYDKNSVSRTDPNIMFFEPG